MGFKRDNEEVSDQEMQDLLSRLAELLAWIAYLGRNGARKKDVDNVNEHGELE